MKEQEKILQKLIDDGVINSLDGAKIEGFKLGWEYALKEDETTFDTIENINDKAQNIINSNKSWETKYDLIFSDDISNKVHELIHLEYYDPDTSYEEDVLAFANALNNWVNDNRD